MKPYVITNLKGTEFWSNEFGWTDISESTKFFEEETKTLNLPMEGKWMTLWEVNSLQFARFIAECEACGIFTDEDRLLQVCDSMDLELDEVYEIVGRAQTFWDNFKDSI